ncbi:MAG TPA: hypothetical protein PLS74_05670, partial [Bacteroidales bacterium]|nr:hypothetical protein [Bacteroidales bacterium]
MKTYFIKNLFFPVFIFLSVLSVTGQVPAGFNYQAIARDVDGNPITDADLLIRIGILTNINPPNVVYEAEYKVRTNQFGLFQLMVGDPLAKPITGKFEDINWTVQPLFLRTMVFWNDKWQDMGSSRLLSVPYAMVAQGVSGIDKLVVTGKTELMEEPLFEVKNNRGQTVFAVYNEGVRVYVGDGDKGVKGGFAIGGFDGSKQEPQEYLRVTSDSTRIFVKNPAKGVKGGFAIGGFDPGKSSTGNYLNLTPENYFIGQEAGANITTGRYNSVLGYQAGRNLVTGNSNTIIGHLAGNSATSGSNNIIIGLNAANNLTTGSSNTIIGSNAGYNHTNQNYNVLIGTSAGENINASGWSGSFNTFIGINAGYQIRNSRDNVFIGTNAGYWLDNGNGNTFVGIDAGRSGEDGQTYNPMVSGNYNVFMGYRAGYNIKNGDHNVAIGFESGYSNTDGTGNIFLGYQAGKYESGSNKLYIANSAESPLIYGDFSARKLGINTMTLNKTFNVNGDADISGTLTASSVVAPVNGNVTGTLNGVS